VPLGPEVLGNLRTFLTRLAEHIPANENAVLYMGAVGRLFCLPTMDSCGRTTWTLSVRGPAS
jgi:hypothetical protein